MATKRTIDSNVSGLRFIEQADVRTLPTTASHQVWRPIEPNTYADTGADITTIARDPINPSRQRQKGVVTDLDATIGWQGDITETEFPRLLRSFLHTEAREKADTGGFLRERTFTTAGAENLADIAITVDNVDGTNDEYDATGDDYTSTASGRVRPFSVGAIIYASGFADSANNGVKTVSTVTATAVGVNETLVDDTSITGNERLQEVGFQFASGDAVLDVGASQFPALTTTTKTLTELGLVVGEWVFIGGDAVGTQFNTVAMRGFARVSSIAANRVEFDKTQADFGTVDDSGAGKTIQLFFGNVMKNESDPDLIVTRYLQFERTLGKPDDSSTDDQAEYIVGSVANDMTLNVSAADKATVDFAFVAVDHETINEAVTGTLKSQVGSVSAPAIVPSDAFNTSSDVSRIRLSTVSEDNSFPTELVAFADELTISVANNVSALKAIGTLGAFDVTIGQFQVSSTENSFFQTVAAQDAIRNNTSVTLDMHMVKTSGTVTSGISFDLPLLTLADGKLAVEKDAAVKIPLAGEAATGVSVNASMDHTVLAVFWPYLPALADT